MAKVYTHTHSCTFHSGLMKVLYVMLACEQASLNWAYFGMSTCLLRVLNVQRF